MACRDAMCCVRGSSAQCEWPLEERRAERGYLMFGREGAGPLAAGARAGIRTRDAGQHLHQGPTAIQPAILTTAERLGAAPQTVLA